MNEHVAGSVSGNCGAASGLDLCEMAETSQASVTDRLTSCPPRVLIVRDGSRCSSRPCFLLPPPALTPPAPPPAPPPALTVIDFLAAGGRARSAIYEQRGIAKSAMRRLQVTLSTVALADTNPPPAGPRLDRRIYVLLGGIYFAHH